MVQWKGEIDPEEAGSKAAYLDRIEKFSVPNFFVVTAEETRELFRNAESKQKVLNSQFDKETAERVEESYDEIGMSSEVREASGEARSLVGGQRNKQRVSVRVSEHGDGRYEYRLNVGSSSLLNSIREVVASYKEYNKDFPPVIIQKMVEPGYTGAAVTNYLGSYGLLETVEGLGVSIEEGITNPDLYLLEKDQVVDTRKADEQVKVSRNAMNGQRSKEISRSSPPFQREEVEDLFQKLERENLNVKFVYKRGSFSIVDAWKPDSHDNPFGRKETELKGVRASKGRIQGTIGRKIAYTDKLPNSFDRGNDALIARKGGYTSNMSQKLRSKGIPAVVSFQEDLKEGQKISLRTEGLPGKESSKQETEQKTDEKRGKEPDEEEDRKEKYLTGSEVLELNPSRGGIQTSPPFTGAEYAVTDRDLKTDTVPYSGHIQSYGDVFAFRGDKAVVDTREMEKKGLVSAIEYIEADLKILLLDDPDRKVIRKAIEEGFQVFGSESDVGELHKAVAREEKRFTLNKLRE